MQVTLGLPHTNSMVINATSLESTVPLFSWQESCFPGAGRRRVDSAMLQEMVTWPVSRSKTENQAWRKEAKSDEI